MISQDEASMQESKIIWYSIYFVGKTIIIMGENGSGKSSFGNALLEFNKFRTSGASANCTMEPQTEVFYYEDKKVQIMDTPGLLFHLEHGNLDIKEQIIESLEKHKITHISSLCLLHKFGVRMDFETLKEQILNIFGNSIINNIIMIITHYDQLVLDDCDEMEEIKNVLQNSIQQEFGENIHIRYFALPNSRALQKIKTLNSELYDHIQNQKISLLEYIRQENITQYQVSEMMEVEKSKNNMKKKLENAILKQTHLILQGEFDQICIPLIFKIQSKKEKGMFKCIKSLLIGGFCSLGTFLGLSCIQEYIADYSSLNDYIIYAVTAALGFLGGICSYYYRRSLNIKTTLRNSAIPSSTIEKMLENEIIQKYEEFIEIKTKGEEPIQLSIRLKQKHNAFLGQEITEIESPYNFKNTRRNSSKYLLQWTPKSEKDRQNPKNITIHLKFPRFDVSRILEEPYF